MTTYNYHCLTPGCISGVIPIRKEEGERDREEFCHECDSTLKCVGQAMNLVIRGDIQTRMLMNQEYFKKRAKKHAQSEEQQHLKKKRQDQEFKSMGIEKK